MCTLYQELFYYINFEVYNNFKKLIVIIGLVKYYFTVDINLFFWANNNLNLEL